MKYYVLFSLNINSYLKVHYSIKFLSEEKYSNVIPENCYFRIDFILFVQYLDILFQIYWYHYTEK